jgi:histidinol dehydrogenase
LNEKRRRRRESHNAVERRRRDHINEKIGELSQLLPEFAGDAQNKPNKGTILKRSVDYVRHIQAFAAKQIERNKELEHVLAAVCEQQGIPLESLGLSVPLGTPIEIPPMTESLTPSENMDEQDE